MCFTVNVNIIKEELEKRYGGTFIDHENHRPSYYYHAFSYPELPVVTKLADGKRDIKLQKWGLIPSWVKSDSEAEEIKKLTHNARAETLGDKVSFSESYSRRRGLLPVNGFYEWKHEAGSKIPYYIFHPENHIMSLAVIYDRWYSPLNNYTLSSFSIVTTSANRLMADIHNTKRRMPVIIDPESEEDWLYIGTSQEKLDQLTAAYQGELSAHTVSPLIGKREVDKNSPELIKYYPYHRNQTLF